MKEPAKPILSQDATATVVTSNNASTSNLVGADDAAFQEFIARVKRVAVQDTQRIPSFAQLQAGVPPSSPTRSTYARFQEAKIYRALSRGNSFNSLSPKSQAPSPGAEWVTDYSRRSITSRSRNGERTWNEETLIARHAFPSSIFCRESESEEAASSPEISLDLSDASDSRKDQSQRRLSLQKKNSRLPRMPDLPALSGVGSASWSEEEQKGVRKFLQLLEQSPSFSNQSSSMYRQRVRAPSPPSGPSMSPPPLTDSAKAREEENSPTLIEISPGVFEPLRPASETVKAVRVDFYVPIPCFGCTQDIFCIADAKYVICPTCRVVSPIEAGALEGRSLKQHGLGLGFSCESLFEMQSEILSER